jgi:hypothetical protein
MVQSRYVSMTRNHYGRKEREKGREEATRGVLWETLPDHVLTRYAANFIPSRRLPSLDHFHNARRRQNSLNTFTLGHYLQLLCL